MRIPNIALVQAVVWGTLALVLAPGLSAADNAAMDRAVRYYRATDYEAALGELKKIPETPDVLSLAGRCYYMLGKYKTAVDKLENAVKRAPRVASHFHWLGRAWGRRAESSNPFQAPVFAGRARESFEEAVRLNPRDLEAVSDLLEYYLEAPGFLGGGVDKAERLAETVKGVSEPEYHSMLARIFRRQNQFDRAERELKRAKSLEPVSVGRIVELARFLAQRGRLDESEALFREAARIAPSSPQWKYAQAETLIEARRDPARARRLLEEYLQGPLTPNDPSREAARRLMERVAKS